MLKLYLDLETKSRVDLKASGARRYAADPSTGITVACWIWRGVKKTACPLFPTIGTHSLFDLYMDVAECVEAGGFLTAHHANFDISVINGQGRNISVPPQNVSCTMGRAQALALPGGLDELCMALNVRGKDPEGKALVMETCKPNRQGNFNENFFTYQKLMAYCVRDVDCLVTVDGLLPELPPSERKIFERTWRKNDIGLPIDVPLAQAIAARREQIEWEVAQELRELTNGAVEKITQRQRIVDWANSGNRAANLPSTKKHEVAEALQDENLHPDVRRVLEILQESGGSAPKKAQALLDRHVSGWYKDATRYFGARSGRGTSEGANLFNVARPSGKFKPSEVIAGLKRGFPYNNTALTDALRGCIVAPDGYAIIDNDLANAELRIALWQAGDTERLNILAANKDLYMANAIKILRLPDSATKETHPKERQVFKSVTLGGNYQLGYRTYMAHQRKEGRRLTEQEAYDDIMGYRRENPLLERLWSDLKNAFWSCYYEAPGRYFFAGKVAFIKDGTTIWMVLPSGRAVPHYSVQVGPDGNMLFWRAKYGAMLPQKVFGGSLLEISCQCITRDIVTAAEERVEQLLPDTHLILDVYDSIVAIAPVDIAAQRAKQMREIMCQQLEWTAGLPIGAEGYVAERMAK